MPVLTFRYCFGHNKSYKVNFDAMLWFDFLVFLSLGFWLIKKVRKCWFLINLCYVFDLKKRKKKISFDRKKSWSYWKIAYKTTNCVHLYANLGIIELSYINFFSFLISYTIFIYFLKFHSFCCFLIITLAFISCLHFHHYIHTNLHCYS
jgi:hypothetical protein